MVVNITSNHYIKENNILVGNSIEYVACECRFATSRICPHQFDGQGRV
uniref:Uncharacterized protein n=1 Tax=Rhizophora mucronata TaxID=61149 RepID=A0A2P2PPC5_RHIMU